MKTFNLQIHLRRFLSFLMIIFLFSNCESFVEVDLPDSRLTGTIVFNDLNTAEATMANLYSKLVNNSLVSGNSNGISLLLGNYADEIQNYNMGISEFQYYQNNLLATDLSIKSFWNNSYNLIYAANAIIEGLETSTLAESDKNKLKGEALFIRAFVHFHLHNLFGEIPYVSSTDYRINTTINKLNTEVIYELITTDLEVAKSLLPSGDNILNKTRVNHDVTKAFLARVYLYNEQWDKAIIEANELINSGNYVWVENLNEVFLKESTGTIWQLKPSNEGTATYEAQSFVFTMGPPPNRAMNENLVMAFEPDDSRKVNWVGIISGDSDNWYYPFKYKQYLSESTSNEYSIMIRLEELYLIRAESLVHLGNFDEAKSDINKIRNRANLQNITTNIEQELLEAIFHERRIELFCELGHRFFDLKRSGKINNVLASIKVGWNSTDVLWPLPEIELMLNPNLLPQNSGY